MPLESPACPPALIHLQRRCNVDSARRWDDFAAHRARMTELVRAAAPAGGAGRLAVLGAGNVNDLDLHALGCFQEIHLFDLDGEALARARLRHGARGVVIRAPLDLSGVLAHLPGLRRRAPGSEQIARLPRACLEAVLARIPERFDVVLSACLLSQILHGAHVALGRGHPSLTAVSCALVLAHVRLLARLLQPRGAGLLVTDVYAAPTAALYGHPPAALLAHLETSQGCAAGTAPSFLQRVLAEDHEVGPLVEHRSLIEPWLWRWSEARSYLVHALIFRARPMP